RCATRAHARTARDLDVVIGTTHPASIDFATVLGAVAASVAALHAPLVPALRDAAAPAPTPELSFIPQRRPTPIPADRATPESISPAARHLRATVPRPARAPVLGCVASPLPLRAAEIPIVTRTQGAAAIRGRATTAPTPRLPIRPAAPAELVIVLDPRAGMLALVAPRAVAGVLAVPGLFSVAELFAVAVLVAVHVFHAVPAFRAVPANAPVLPVVPRLVQPPAAAATPGPVFSPIPRHWHSSWMTSFRTDGGGPVATSVPKGVPAAPSLTTATARSLTTAMEP